MSESYKSMTEFMMFEDAKNEANKMKRFVDKMEPAQAQEYRDYQLEKVVSMLPENIDETIRILKDAMNEYS